jgi:hypothetical protein
MRRKMVDIVLYFLSRLEFVDMHKECLVEKIVHSNTVVDLIFSGPL